MQATRAKYIVFFCIALHAAITFSCAVSLHYEFKTSALDILLFMQPVQNFIDGHGLTTSVKYPFVPQHILGIHFSPILYLFIPLYYIFPHIETFLAVGSICVALAAWPIFLTASEILKSPSQALVIALLYLINPYVFNGVAWNFHEVDFAPLCVAFMLWAVVRHKRNTLLALSVVLMCIKEHYGPSVAGFGLLWAWHWRQSKPDIKFGCALAVLAIAVCYVILCVVIPSINHRGSIDLLNKNAPGDFFSWIFHIESIKAHIDYITTDGLLYATGLFLPFLLLPLGAFMWLLPALGDAAVNTLSLRDMFRSHFSYYSIAMMPVIIIACCQSLKAHIKTSRIKDVLLAITMASLCFSNLFLTVPFSAMGNIWQISVPHFDYSEKDRKAIDDINKLIPPNAPIAAESTVLAHLKTRFEMYRFPIAISNANYVVLHFAYPFKQASAPIFGIPYNKPDLYFPGADSLLHNKEWGVVYFYNNWVVLQKDGVDDAQAHRDAVLAFYAVKKLYDDAFANAFKPHKKKHKLQGADGAKDAPDTEEQK